MCVCVQYIHFDVDNNNEMAHECRVLAFLVSLIIDSSFAINSWYSLISLKDTQTIK